MNRNKVFRFLIFILTTFLVSNNIYAQNNSPDSTDLPYPYHYFDNPLLNNRYNSPLYMQTPSVYQQDIQYDPITGNFVIVEKVGNIVVTRPYVMSFDDYNTYRTNSIMQNNWRTNLKTGNRTDENDFLSNFLSPQINLGLKGIDKIFGSDQITVQPNGNVDITLGISYYNQNNPTLSKRQRRQTIFDFTQDIQLGVNGKVGDKMNVGINYNTKALFDFENRKKIDYTGEEDEIIQKIEAGDVTFPLENTLIQGSNTLFGIRTDLKFGKFTVTSVFSHQRGESKTIEVQGGAVLNDFEISASEYESDKHFFLSHYFRDHYEEAMANLPIITSPVKITRIEVWVTNKTSDFENARNIVAFMDLGESNGNIYATALFNQNGAQQYPSNNTNTLYEMMTTTYSGIRNISAASNILTGISGFSEGVDFVKLESARKLNSNEYSVNTELGFISINYQLRSGEILAVAYEYTIDGKTYQVGEFSNDIEAPQTLILKLLRGPAAIPTLPTWDLMMKNIYSLNTYSLSPEDFQLEVYYNNDRTGTAINYIPEGEIANQRLLKVLNLDNADNQGNANPDGFFDFMEGVTVISQKGSIIFPELEPFGNYLKDQIGNNQIAQKYIFTDLYDSTQYIAQQNAVKNKFYLRGRYKSSGGSQIMLNVMNVPQGSVKVTQGGQELNEGTDYTVDYNIGSVTILNESLLNSGMPIKISLESNDMFGMTTKSLLGSHFNYQFNEKFNIGGTVVHLSELPVDVKTRFGTEPISNTIYGFNTNYSREVPFLTQMVDFLPFIETKAPSNFNFTGEFAQLIPGNPRVLDKEGISFLDDFEDSQTDIDLKAPNAWVLASIPQGQSLFPEAKENATTISGYNRAKLSWYDINEDLVAINSTTRPDYISVDDVSNHLVRLVYEKEIFPNKQNYGNTPTRMTVLNLAYYPEERGPYNFDTEGEPGISEGINESGDLNAPETRWAGIMRDLYINDFESSNIGFLEFWLLDPFIYDSLSTGGDLYVNLGDISEDILKDSRKSVENGIPYPSDPTKIDTTQWGIVSKIQVTTRNFDNNPDARAIQDAGYDGILDDAEKSFFNNYLQKLAQMYGVNSSVYQKALQDPSNDNFKYFIDEEYDNLNADILERYKAYNGTQGNSPTNTGNQNFTSVSQFPDIEDVNSDNTLDLYEAYYQYRIHLEPGQMNVGENYIVNKVDATVPALPNKDNTQHVTWYQFKIPIKSPDQIIGTVQGFKSIRFIRLFMTNFESPIVLRFAKMNLIKEEWRQYENTITEGGEITPTPEPEGNGTLDISVVNIEESTQKEPVNYILPPGVTREQDFFDQQARKLNEQAMTMKVVNLPDGEAKGVYKNLDIDLRKFNKLKMFVHAEALIDEEQSLNDGDLNIFVRLGSDFTNNYYEYEIPLKKTPAGSYSSTDEDIEAPARYVVWPSENEMDLSLALLLEAKQMRNEAMSQINSNVSLNTPYWVYDGENKITVIGNPNLANVKSIMIGIRNPKQENNLNNDDGLIKSAEIWVNELRLTDFNSDGGWAANARVSANFADFANVTLSGYTHTPGFGSVEKRVNERYEDQALEYDLTTQVQFGKFFPKEYGVSIPLYMGLARSISNPEYNPFDPDIKFNDALSTLTDDEKSSLKNAAQTYTQRRSFNLTNISIQGKPKKNVKGDVGNRVNKKSGNKTKITPPWKISNFSASIAFNETYSRTPIIEFHKQQNFMQSFNYNYSPNPKVVKPFKKVKFLNHKALRLIKDFNFYYLPTRVSFTSEVNRQYITFKNREISDADINLPTSYQKNFLWARNYDVTYKLSNSLRLDFTATNSSRVEPDGWNETLFQKWGVRHPSDTVLLNIYDLGRNTDYNQQVRVNYRVPIDKIPLLGWTSLTADYNTDYDWRRGQDPYTIEATDTTDAHIVDFGNAIQNAATLRLNGRLDFIKLYNSAKYLKKVNSRFTKNGRTPVKREDKDVSFTSEIRLKKGVPVYITHNMKTENITKFEVKTQDGKPIKSENYEIVNANRIKFTPDTTLNNVKLVIQGKKQMNENIFIIASDYTLKTMMMLQGVSINYKKAGGTLINGYRPNAILFGSQKVNNELAPGWEFITGLQDRLIVDEFAQRNWLTEDTLFNLPVNFTESDEIRVRVNVEPINNLKIDFNFQRNITLNESIYGYTENGSFTEQTKMKDGNFFISFNTILSAFDNIDSSANFYSKYYENFLNGRQDIAYELARQRSEAAVGYVFDTYVDTLGHRYPVGYSHTSQDVLLLSFLSAYSGISVDKLGFNPFLAIPLPDWRLTFDGLSNLPFVKNYVKKISLTHAYSSTYGVNNFNSNPNYNFYMYDELGTSDAMYETNGLFIPQYEISGIMISEKFTPFFGLDITWMGPLSTRFEYKRARDLFLSFSNNQVRERHNNSFTFGGGYTFKELKMTINVGGKPQKLNSDLNLRLDFTKGHDIEIYRKIVENISQENTERDNFSLTFTADYSINDKLSIQYYYNHSVMETNTNYRTTNVQTGFKIRFALTP
ncbi:MAG: cell surface protein SprA [Bacteroidales bacterium]|nr:cell surface protein SprA [Bacteroidales bacterium]